MLRKGYWLSSVQFGIDPLRPLRSLRGLPHFVASWWRFRNGYSGRLTLMPCLHDRYEGEGVTKSEYFWQDLLVARWIHQSSPDKHVDVGSRVDGFVAHVASFREIEVLDVRPISTSIPGVTFKKADLMDAFCMAPMITERGYCDSLSCLHVLEHLGLGRYGDPIDPSGYQRGLAHMAALLKPSGLLYLSTPMGRERVEFNANWVFAPRTILELAGRHGLRLERFLVFKSDAGFVPTALADLDQAVATLAVQPYHLVVMQFIKRPS